jgi:5-methylcytosine-specific restriction endonuclease McrA
MEENAKTKVCIKCGVVFIQRGCPNCKASLNKKYKAENAERLLVQNAAYYAANKEKISVKQRSSYAEDIDIAVKKREAVKAWYQINKVEVQKRRAARKLADPERTAAARARQREIDKTVPGRLEDRRRKGAKYRRDNYEKNRAKREAYNAANSARIVSVVAEWRKKNPEAVARHANNRRARKLAAGGEISRGLSDRLFKLQKGRCACCGEKLGVKYDLDHIVPLALGGSNEDNNIQLLRPRCNAKKSAKDPIVFMQSKGFLI